MSAILAPVSLYTAPDGTAAPSLDALPTGPLWTHVADGNIGGDGVAIEAGQNVVLDTDYVNKTYPQGAYLESQFSRIQVPFRRFNRNVITALLGRAPTMAADHVLWQLLRQNAVNRAVTVVARSSYGRNLAVYWYIPRMAITSGIAYDVTKTPSNVVTVFDEVEHPTLGIGRMQEAHLPSPVFVSQQAPLAATVGTPVAQTLPAAQGGTGTLTLAVQFVPADGVTAISGVTFDPITRVLSFTPQTANRGEHTARYTATDTENVVRTQTFTIVVS